MDLSNRRALVTAPPHALRRRRSSVLLAGSMMLGLVTADALAQSASQVPVSVRAAAAADAPGPAASAPPLDLTLRPTAACGPTATVATARGASPGAPLRAGASASGNGAAPPWGTGFEARWCGPAAAAREALDAQRGDAATGRGADESARAGVGPGRTVATREGGHAGDLNVGSSPGAGAIGGATPHGRPAPAVPRPARGRR